MSPTRKRRRKMEGGNTNEKMLFVTSRNKMACSAFDGKKNYWFV